jgi:putative flippase GtrA
MPEMFRQIVRFTGVGFISAIGHFGLLIMLVKLAAVDPVVASVAGALLGAGINYSLNYRFTFRSTKRHSESMVKFAIIAVIGLMLNTVFMWLCVKVVGLHYLPGQIITTGLVFIWSFSANRYWTFHVQSPRE